MKQWEESVGKARERYELVSHKDLLGLASLLDYQDPAGTAEKDLPWPIHSVPPFAHWLNGNPPASQSALGDDGHPEKGLFLPNISYPHRMWAGSRVRLLQCFAAQQTLLHRETIKSITHKSGRSGEMVFVTVQHDYLSEDTPVLWEEQDIVYRAGGGAGPSGSEESLAAKGEAEVLALHEFDWCRPVHPDPVLLFRYSAVSFNGHRIHYDREYATRVEGYPGLVVHGPLTATLLLDLYWRNNPGQEAKEFEFRGLRPLFDIHPFYIMGKQTASGADLWAVDYRGEIAMQMSLSTK